MTRRIVRSAIVGGALLATLGIAACTGANSPASKPDMQPASRRCVRSIRRRSRTPTALLRVGLQPATALTPRRSRNAAKILSS